MKLYFELKPLADKKRGTVRAVISDHGRKTYITTAVKAEIKDWKDGKLKQTAKNANNILALENYKSNFAKYLSLANLADEIPTPSRAQIYIRANIKNANTTRGQKNLDKLFSIFAFENVGKLKDGALKPYNTLKNHLLDFNSKLHINDIDEVFGDKFVLYLSRKSEYKDGSANLQNPTINKMIVTLKAFCKWAVKRKFTVNREWMGIKRVKETEQRIIALTIDEFDKYSNFNFGKNYKLARQRDVFAFGVYTGFRFEDLSNVKEYIVHKNGSFYVHLNTDKTASEVEILLVDQAVSILKRYDFKLPIISNQNTNKYIKEGVKLCGITRVESIIKQHLSHIQNIKRPVHELISIHDARKTFITIALEQGLSISEIMVLSTHKDFRSLSRYISLERARVNKKLSGVFPMKIVA